MITHYSIEIHRCIRAIGVASCRLPKDGIRPAGVEAEPPLFIILDYTDKYIANNRVEFQHNFTDCSPSSLKALIKAKEPMPLDCIVNRGRFWREMISQATACLISYFVRVQGMEKMERLGVFIAVVYSEESTKGVFIYSRMLFPDKDTFMGGSGEDGEEERCAICLDEMVAGKEVVCTPCNHYFHAGCIQIFCNYGPMPNIIWIPNV